MLVKVTLRPGGRGATEGAGSRGLAATEGAGSRGLAVTVGAGSRGLAVTVSAGFRGGLALCRRSGRVDMGSSV